MTASDTWVIEKIKEDIETLGYQDVVLKRDCEPAWVQVLENVKICPRSTSIIQQLPAVRSGRKTVQGHMGHGRVMKSGLEARLKFKVKSDWKVMEWITELAGEVLSRGQVGKDGRTTYSRLYGRNSANAVLEIGEQVTTKLLRGRKSQSKLSLKEGWVFATWVGRDPKTNEHVVVIGEGGAAIRVRTVLGRPASDKWNVDAVKAMQASLRVPNPHNLRQVAVKPERLTKKIEFEGDGSVIRDDEVLRERLDLCDVGLNRDAECEKNTRPEELKVSELMREAEAAGGNVARSLAGN